MFWVAFMGGLRVDSTGWAPRVGGLWSGGPKAGVAPRQMAQGWVEPGWLAQGGWPQGGRL